MKKTLRGLMGRTGRIGAVAVALLQLAGPALAASEMHAPQVFYRDVAVSTWAPTVTVSSITSTNGGAFAATGAWFYAVAAQSSLGKTTNGPVTNVTVTATGYYVRVTWPSYGGATNYLLYRGSTASNLTNYVAVAQQGVTNVYVDYGTNAWTVGTPSNSITTVPWLKLPSASYTPTGNDAVRASDIAGFDASNFYTRAQADAAFVNTNETNSVTTQMIQDGTIVGADLAANAITPEAMGTNVAVSVTNFDGSVDVRYLNASGVDSQYGTVIVNHETVTGAFTLASGRGIQTTGTVGGAALVAQHSTAVDLQTVRTDTNSVASGNGSAVLGGRNNRASGSWSTTVGGQNNQALANYAIAGGISAVASGAAAVAMGYAPNAGADYSAAFGYSPSATHTGSFVWSDSAIGVWGAGGATSLRDHDFTVRAFGGARFFTGTNGLVVYNSSTVGVIRIGGPDGGVVIGTNSFKLDASGNVTATDVYMRIAVGRSNDHPVTVGQMVDSNAMKQARPTNAWALYYSDGASNLVPVQLGQAGSVPVSQGSNSPPLMQLPTATATNVAMSNLLDVAGTAWNTNFLLRFNGTAWQAVDQTNLTVGTALNANLLDGYDSSAFQLYLGAVTNNGGFLVGFTNGTYGWAPSLTASATNVIDSAVTVTHSATNYTASTNNAQAHLRGIDARLAVLAAGTGNASRIHSRAISTNAPSHGDVYQWDTNTASWIPAAVSGGGGSSGNATSIQSRFVSTNAPTQGQALLWDTNTTSWLPSTLSATTAGNATQIQGRAVSTNAPTDGQVMEWSTNCACWLPATDDTGGAGGGDVYATSNNVFSGRTNMVLGKLEFTTNATQVDRFALFQEVVASTNLLVLQNQGGDRSDLFIMYGKGGSVTQGVSAIKLVNDSVIGPSNTALVLRSNRGFTGTHTNGFAVTLKNSGGAALEPLFFLMDEDEVFHYGLDLGVRFQHDISTLNGQMAIGTTNSQGSYLWIQAATPTLALNITNSANYGTMSWRENGTQLAVLQQIGTTFSGSLGSGNRQRDLEIASLEGGDIVFHVGNGGAFSHKYMIIKATNAFVGILNNNPTEALSVSGNVQVIGNVLVSGGGYFGSNSVWIGKTHIGETQLQGLYLARKISFGLAIGFALLLVNFVMDRRERKRDARRFAELERLIKGSAVHDR